MYWHSSNFLHGFRLGLAALVVAGGAVLAAACSGAGDDPTTPAAQADPEAEAHPTVDPNATPTPDPGPADTTVRVELHEWSVAPGKKEVPAGVIQFIADNTGKETHELVILKDGEELGEIEGLAAGHVQALRIRLEPGKYELACLIVETEPNGTKEDHYKLGMHTPFDVK
jgi:hypothetical protein